MRHESDRRPVVESPKTTDHGVVAQYYHPGGSIRIKYSPAKPPKSQRSYTFSLREKIKEHISAKELKFTTPSSSSHPDCHSKFNIPPSIFLYALRIEMRLAHWYVHDAKNDNMNIAPTTAT